MGLAQCVYWGILYYGFALLLLPLSEALRAERSLVAGAFSTGLLVMALVSSRLGHALDRGHGALLMNLGVLCASVGLLVLSQAHGLLQLYMAWLLLGLAMAALLYETAFGLIARAIPGADQRLRALAAVSVGGGLASTVALPVLALLFEHVGWRAGLWVATVVLLLTGLASARWVLPVLHAAAMPSIRTTAPVAAISPANFAGLRLIFVVSTLAGMAVTTLLIPVLVAHGESPTRAALVLGLLGLMQLPGRLWVLSGGRAASVRSLLLIPLLLQAAAMVLLVWPDFGAWWAALAVLAYGLGAGLFTLARPWLVEDLYGMQHFGWLNARIAAAQSMARACGPVLIVWCHDRLGNFWVFAGLAALLLLLLVPISTLMRSRT